MAETKVFEFTKKDTQLCKGFAILIMMFHHMYMSTDRFEGFKISFAPFTQEHVVRVSSFFKICVGIFVFISSYGLVLSYKNNKKKRNSVTEFILTRYIKLIVFFWFVYILSVIITAFTNEHNIFNFYWKEGNTAALWHMLIDFLGLADLFGTPVFCGTWWYMSLAVSIIFLIPFLSEIYDRFGIGILLFLIIPIAFRFEKYHIYIYRYALCIILGIAFANTNLIGKIKRNISDGVIKRRVLILFVFCMIFMLSFLCRTNSVLEEEYLAIWEGTSAASVIVLVSVFIARIPIINSLLLLFGKYSTAIFLSHTFIRVYYLYDFVYSRGHFLINYLVLVVLSLVVAIVLELLAKVLRIESIKQSICDRIHIFCKKDSEMLINED